MSAEPDTHELDVSIVIPIGLGDRPWLEHSLKSIACQGVSVGVALCAAEDSPALQDMIVRYGDIISYTRIGPDRGQSAAINEGWANVRARYYGWLNDDDILHPDALTHVVHLFDETRADVVHGRSDILTKSVLKSGYGSRPVGDALLRDNSIAQPSTFVRDKALENVSLKDGPLDMERHYTMDWDLWQRLYLSGAKFVATEQSLSITRWYSGTKTSAASTEKYREYRDLLKRGNRGPRSLWAMANIFIHNQATYGPYGPLFRPMTSALSILRKRQKTAQSTILDVFHYEDSSLTPIVINDGEETLHPPLPAAQVLSVEADSVRLEP